MPTKFVVWDVQHGNATYIATPGGRHFVIDLGQGRSGPQGSLFSPLTHIRDELGVQRLDGVTITHPHRDHLDDIAHFDEMKPRALMRPTHLSEEDIRAGNRSADQGIIDQYLEIHRRYSGSFGPGESPYLPDNNGGVVFQCFVPSESSQSNLNNHSVVTVVTFATSRIVIPGDNESTSWQELMKSETFCSAVKDADVLVAPHHGRDAGYDSDFVDLVSPRLTIISDGRFGDTSATDRYAAKTSGWTVHRRGGGQSERKCVTTRQDGDINVEFGFDGQRPYISVSTD